MTPRPPDATDRGFSLIQMSILLTAAALVMVAVLPSSQSNMGAGSATTSKLNTLLTSLRAYEAANGLLPCPADATMGTANTNFGVAAAGAGTTNNCGGSSPAANTIDSTDHIALGMVPVKTLGLPNEYAIDNYGREITYAVDTHATTCWSSSPLAGAISVTDNGAAVSGVAAVLVSGGADGYGAWVPYSGTGGTGTAKQL